MKAFFPVLLLLPFPLFAGPISDAEYGSRPEVYGLEDTVQELLEMLRQLLRVGNPEFDIPPMDPLHITEFYFDFYLEDTELRGYLKDTTVRNLSCFEVGNVTASLRPNMQLNLELSFQELSASGFYSLIGSLFGDLPVDGFGLFDVRMTNLTIFLDAKLRSRAGVLQIRDLSMDLQLQKISVEYQNLIESNEMKTLPESFVKGILERFKVEYLSLLLNTLKIIANDSLLSLFNSGEHSRSSEKEFYNCF